MKTKATILFIVTLLSLSCSDDEKTIEFVESRLERGAILRTLKTHSAEYHPGELNSEFKIEIEEQDLEEGALLDRVEVRIAFKDNTPENGNNSVAELSYGVLTKDDFEVSDNGLPKTTLSISYQQALTATGLDMSNTRCKDQFVVRLFLHLTDGRSFNADDLSSIVQASGSFFRSPMLYFINVVDPLPEDTFVGTYDVQSLIASTRTDGVLFFADAMGEFGGVNLFEVKKGHSRNTRIITGYYANGYLDIEQLRDFEFTIACDQVIFQHSQYSSYKSPCLSTDPIILLGPSETIGACDPNDDSVFDLYAKEGYLGFDGGCGFDMHTAAVRFSKQ